MPTFYHVLCNLTGWFLTNYNLLNIYQFDCFMFYNREKLKQEDKLPFLLNYFRFWILENNKIKEKFLKKAMVGISREIWCSNWKTRGFGEKLGDSLKNRESLQVCNWLKSIPWVDLSDVSHKNSYFLTWMTVGGHLEELAVKMEWLVFESTYICLVQKHELFHIVWEELEQLDHN